MPCTDSFTYKYFSSGLRAIPFVNLLAFPFWVGFKIIKHVLYKPLRALAILSLLPLESLFKNDDKLTKNTKFNKSIKKYNDIEAPKTDEDYEFIETNIITLDQEIKYNEGLLNDEKTSITKKKILLFFVTTQRQAMFKLFELLIDFLEQRIPTTKNNEELLKSYEELKKLKEDHIINIEQIHKRLEENTTISSEQLKKSQQGLLKMIDELTTEIDTINIIITRLDKEILEEKRVIQQKTLQVQDIELDKASLGNNNNSRVITPVNANTAAKMFAKSRRAPQSRGAPQVTERRRHTGKGLKAARARK